MADMNAFERQIATEIQRAVGPAMPVDDEAVFEAATSTTLRSRDGVTRWFPGRVVAHTERGFSMFSVVKLVAVAAIIALFAGIAGLSSTLTSQRDTAPGASPATELVATEEWTSQGDPAANLTRYNSVGLDAAGNLWVLDGYRSQFQIIAPDGLFIESWGASGTGEGEFDFTRPDLLYYGDIAFAPDGGFYVADSDNQRVQRFDGDRSFVTAWGSEGVGDGQFIDPIGVAVGPDGRVYVIDDERDVVQVFDADGQFLFLFGGKGSEPGQLRDTGFIDIDTDGTVYIADYGNNRISKYTAEGEFISDWGQKGDDPYGFYNPHGIDVGPDGRVYLADFRNAHIKVFDRDGQHLATWGGGAEADGVRISGPVGVAVADDGSVYVSDYFGDRISKLAVEEVPVSAE